MSVAAVRGLLRVAQFQRDGLADFDATPAGLLNALAPWLAFAAVMSLMLAYGVGARLATQNLLESAVMLLAPPVLSHALARLWGREARWLRYAVIFAWSQWLLLPALLLAMLGNVFLDAAGLPDEVSTPLSGLALVAYGLALHVFIARRALDLSKWRAVALVAAHMCIAAAVMAPEILMDRAANSGEQTQAEPARSN